jgi:tetratricopeptide (TPR) repeat protein
LASAGRCEQALPVLDRARRASPDDARVPHIAGRCQIRLERYSDAIASFEEAKRLDPQLPDVDLLLAIARFHFGDLTGAERALADARKRTPRRAEIDLYQGLILLQRGEAREAAETLERAQQTDPDAVEPIASYSAGLAWRRAGDETRAREALNRVGEEAPESAWAEAADRDTRQATEARGLLDRRDLQGQQQAERPLGTMSTGERERSWLTLSLGAEYDDNVVLRGNSVPLPREISDEDDVRLVWTTELGLELFRNSDWIVGIIPAYYGSAHRDLSEFNVHYPSITAWVDRRLGEYSSTRFQYDFAYAWVGTDPYLASHTLTPAFFHEWPRIGTTRLFVELGWNNFLFSIDNFPDGAPGGKAGDPCPPGLRTCGPFGLNEETERNRDGFEAIYGIDHAVPLGFEGSEVRGGYRYHRYNSRGSEFSFQGHEVRLGGRAHLPFDLILDLQGSYTYRGYRHPSTYPDPGKVVFARQYPLDSSNRRERAFQFDAILELALAEPLIASIRYSYLDNHSDTVVFDYDRNVIGVYLTVRLR